MTARLFAPLRSLRGLTLVETAVVLLIVAIIAVPLTGIASQFLFLPVEWQANVTAMRDAREAVKWAADDARQAACFSLGIQPDYGTFAWTDFTVDPAMDFTVRYYYETSTTSLMREEIVNDLSTTRPIIDSIADFGDFSIWLASQNDQNRVLGAWAKTTVENIRGQRQSIHEIAAMMRPSTKFAELLHNCT